MIWLAQALAGSTALVVGANAPGPGTVPLRYSHSDAERVADTLSTLGGFDRVEVLLDPDPNSLLTRIDAIQAEGDDLLFYYSGHGDTQQLFPNGRPLPLEDLRTRLNLGEDRMNIGILDTCRGGAWTQTKGLVQDAEPFSLGEMKSVGQAFIASTSGLEDAHELERIKGSLFTHHLIAGLRGAADRSGEGEVTLLEAFSHAKDGTARDAALFAERPQTPSYSFNIRGREDVVLTRVSRGDSLVHLRQRKGPLELFQLDRGIVLASWGTGEREVSLSVPPGRYVLRKTTKAGVRGTQFQVRSGQDVSLAESTLSLQTQTSWTTKGGAIRNDDLFLLPKHGELAVSVSSSDLLSSLGELGGTDFQARYAASKRLMFSFPARAHVRVSGVERGPTLVLSGGVTGFVGGGISWRSFYYFPTTTPGNRAITGLETRWTARAWHPVSKWLALDGGVTLVTQGWFPAVGLVAGADPLHGSKRFSSYIGLEVYPNRFVRMGSMDRLGRQTPLFSWHAHRRISADAYLTLEIQHPRAFWATSGLGVTVSL